MVPINAHDGPSQKTGMVAHTQLAFGDLRGVERGVQNGAHGHGLHGGGPCAGSEQEHNDRKQEHNDERADDAGNDDYGLRATTCRIGGCSHRCSDN